VRALLWVMYVGESPFRAKQSKQGKENNGGAAEQFLALSSAQDSVFSLLLSSATLVGAQRSALLLPTTAAPPATMSPLHLATSFEGYRKRGPGSRPRSRSSPLQSIPNNANTNTNTNTNAFLQSRVNRAEDAPSVGNKNRQYKFEIMYRRFSTKKNKTWEANGWAYYNKNQNQATLRTDENVQIGFLKNADRELLKDPFRSSGYEFCLESPEEFEDFLRTGEPPTKAPKLETLTGPTRRILIPDFKPFKSPILIKPKQKPIVLTEPEHITDGNEHRVGIEAHRNQPAKQSHVGVKSVPSNAPLYDPSTIENPLILPDMPRSIDISERPRKVVVDPSLSAKLRPHQRYGVEFLYSCLMGLRAKDVRGAILADEMGLGKTLQTITLIWTLLRQSPLAGTKPVASKVLICCPVSLVDNWKKEFNKWLGLNRVGVLAINNNKYQNEKQNIEQFPKNKVYQIMIIGYEKMQSMSESLSEIKFDLLVCDEGHRLKNSENKVMKTLKSFNIRRLILLTGTPIQNDLMEFYTMADFVNPGVLGSLKSFQKEFIKPILDSRDANCTNRQLTKKGKEKSKELMKLTNNFILRRSNAELTKYLPKRSDYIIFVPPTPLQLQLFKTILSTQKFKTMVEDAERNEKTASSSSSFNMINTFRKLCNSPSLLQTDSFYLEMCERQSDDPEDVNFRAQLAKKIKSGKMMALIKLLALLSAKTEEKIVIVSNFTATLNIIESVFRTLNLSYTRLDGSTPSNDRGSIVDKFNRSPASKCFAILLSAKAGGVGLNLIGASRLVLFDNDWNPAIDLQAIARIHRDGQKRDVKIYRLLTSGCMDEKIFQRQLVKQDLSDKFIDQKGGETELFERTDIKDIFTVPFEKMESKNYCNTHELMGCECYGKGEIIFENEFASDLEGSSEEESDEEDASATTKEKKKFMSALEFSQKFPHQQQTDVSTERKKKLRSCLKGYKHINPLNEQIVHSTDDAILDTLINGQDKSKPIVSYVFGKY
jgi:DNA repair and recombination protein RAD54B